MAKTTKTALPVIGKVGSLSVVDYNGFACIQLTDRVLMGTGKVKAVLEHLAEAKEFVAKWDKPKTVPMASPADKASLEAQHAALTAQLAALNASNNNAGRVDPLAKSV